MLKLSYFLFNLLLINAASFIFVSMVQASQNKVTHITVWEHTINHREQIIIDLLTKSLQVTTKEYGDFKINSSPKMEQKRALQQLSIKSGAHIDIGHFVGTRERESQGIPIYIPLIKGLLGYRICLIKEVNQAKFTDIANKQDFIDASLSIGQHQDWPDTDILKSNNIIVTTTYKRHLLFQQLDNHRFHCYSRGVNEITFELASQPELDIKIEDSLLIYYPFPLYLFVNQNEPELAARVELGLQRLKKSGEFDKLFAHYYKERLSSLNLQQRKMIKLNNPTISEKSKQIMEKQTPPI